MDIEKLEKVTIELENLLIRHQQEIEEACICLSELRPIFEKIKDKKHLIPMKTIPCDHYFHEGSLREIDGLEEAYSMFSILARGQDPDQIKNLIDSI
jgi:hypothetical protein